MNRRSFLIGSGLIAGSGLAALAQVPAYRLDSGFQTIQSLVGYDADQPIPVSGSSIWKTPETWAAHLIQAAESQIGVTKVYDPSYSGLSYPNGDISRERGVCTDVVVRAYRDAFGFDLQKAVYQDMRPNFAQYPKIWGLKRPDRNIDHRRVPNLQTFFKRKGAALPPSSKSVDYEPGDLVTQMLPRNLPHIAIVTHRKSRDGLRPLLVHNIGAGTRLEDRLFDFEITGRYRFKPAGVS